MKFADGVLRILFQVEKKIQQIYVILLSRASTKRNLECSPFPRTLVSKFDHLYHTCRFFPLDILFCTIPDDGC